MPTKHEEQNKLLRRSWWCRPSAIPRRSRYLVGCGLLVLMLGVMPDEARAQTAGTAPISQQGWYVSVYPILAWIPFNIGIDVNIPGSGGGGGAAGSIVESRLDGAFFGGVTASKGAWRIEGYGIWAAFGGDRLELPRLSVDLDIIYGQGRVGRRIARDFYVTGGVRRVAVKYDITIEDFGHFSRKPGVWDPLVGVGWHRVRDKVEWHASFDGGGFGAGADVDLGGSFRVEWKPWPHFGVAAGYDALYLKLSDSKASQNLSFNITAHGPTFGIGLYF